jgi:hypothetical protein
MVQGARNDSIRRNFELRLAALRGVKEIEIARDRFLKDRDRLPLSLQELVSTGYLHSIPADPYGGEFFLEPGGMIRSTSKLAPRREP